MTELEIRDKKVLFSYKTPVACYNPGLMRTNPWFRTEQYWSRTTSKHINFWLNSYGITNVITIPQAELDKLVNEPEGVSK